MNHIRSAAMMPDMYADQCAEIALLAAFSQDTKARAVLYGIVHRRLGVHTCGTTKHSHPPRPLAHRGLRKRDKPKTPVV
jgi:hypothetical protein